MGVEATAAALKAFNPEKVRPRQLMVISAASGTAMGTCLVAGGLVTCGLVAGDLIRSGPVDPPPTGAERAMLEGWLEYHRATLLIKCDGLDDAQRKRRPVGTSLMSLHGLVRHLADVERNRSMTPTGRPTWPPGRRSVPRADWRRPPAAWTTLAPACAAGCS